MPSLLQWMCQTGPQPAAAGTQSGGAPGSLALGRSICVRFVSNVLVGASGRRGRAKHDWHRNC